jgi:hypothetical protein
MVIDASVIRFFLISLFTVHLFEKVSASNLKLVFNLLIHQPESLMLRSLEGLQFVKSHAGCLEIQMSPQGKTVEVSLDFQTLQLESRIRHGKDMIVLCGNTSHRRFTSPSDRKRVIWSWLTYPFTIVDKPVAVA